MRNNIYILLFLVVLVSCKKEDELQNSFDSESISTESVMMHGDTTYDEWMCIYSDYSYIKLYVGQDTVKKEYLWTPTNQTNSKITVNKPGRYSLRLINHNDSVPDTTYYSINLTEAPKYELYIPNAFTPDGTGYNDTWRPLGGKVEKYNVKVYNKENQVVFSTYNIREGWTGVVSGQIQPNNSVFRYVVKVKFFNDDNTKVYKGYVRLLN